MAGLNKWIVIVAALIIGIAAGMVLHEAFDVFGSIGLGSQRTALRTERDELKRIHEDRIKLLEENFDLNIAGVRQDRDRIQGELEEKQRRLAETEERNRILEGGKEASGRAADQAREGLRSVERLERLVGKIE